MKKIYDNNETTPDAKNESKKLGGEQKNKYATRPLTDAELQEFKSKSPKKIPPGKFAIRQSFREKYPTRPLTEEELAEYHAKNSKIPSTPEEIEKERIRLFFKLKAEKDAENRAKANVNDMRQCTTNYDESDDIDAFDKFNGYGRAPYGVSYQSVSYKLKLKKRK